MAPVPPLPKFLLLALALPLLAGTGAWAQSSTPPTPPTAPARKAAMPARMLTVELRVAGEPVDATGSQQWSARADSEEEWQKLSVANGEKARFEVGTAQAWAWTHTAVRGNGAGSADAVGQSLQWTRDARTIECEVQWAGGNKPARIHVAVQAQESGRGLVEGVPPQPRHSAVQTVVWAPLGQWVTLARTGPRPAQVADGSYSSRSAEAVNARVLQVRVLVPD